VVLLVIIALLEINALVERRGDQETDRDVPGSS